jgi:hypothetical protein
MKKLLLGSLVLLLFSASIIIFNISCNKESDAQTTNYVLPPATSSSLGGIIVGNGLSINSNGVLSVTSGSGTGSGSLNQLNKIIFTKKREIWSANYDGTNQSKINILMPSGYTIVGDGSVKLSPDGKKLFFSASKSIDLTWHIFSCNIDGSDVKLIIDGTSSGPEGLFLGGAY